MTKYAVAKKLLKKNMQLNMKVKFDEEGEEVRNRVDIPML